MLLAALRLEGAPELPLAALARDGFVGDVAACEAALLVAARSSRPDVVLVSAPSGAAAEAARRLSPPLSKDHLPLVMVVSGGGEVARALDADAADALDASRASEELSARLRSAARRRVQPGNPLVFGPLELDLGRRVALVDGVDARLTAKELRLLEVLAARQGGLASRDHIMNRLYGGADPPGHEVIDVLLCKMRKRLGPAGKLIKSLRGAGWRLEGGQ